MPYFFYYLLKVILCSAVLFGYYHLFLRNKVYHAYNRFYLLASTVIALAAPLFNFQVLFEQGAAVAKPIQLLQAVNSSDAYMEEIVVYTQRTWLTTSQVLMLAYLLVSVTMLAVLIRVFIQIFTILKTHSSRNLHDVVFVQSDARGTPFSFFKFIFWNKAIDINTPTGRQIFAHELAHVREKHSADKLYINLLLIVFWINPIFWLIKKELNLIHEFIADRKAIADNDAGALAAMIVQSAYPQHSYLLTSHFFYSPIKRRLKMLTKYSNKKAGYLYRILALQLVLLIVAALTIKAKSGITELMNPDKKITVVIDAGHGGMDAGAYSSDGSINEKNLALSLVKKIKELNNLPNINLVFTREADVYQSPREKAEFTSSNSAELFISVHLSNAPTTAKIRSGAEVYVSKDYYANSAASKLFASSVISHFKNNYGLEMAAAPIQRQTGIHVLQQAGCPAVLIEAGWMNNPKDVAYLRSEKGQTDFANNILAAIAQYADARKNNIDIFEVPAASRDTVPTFGIYKGEKVTQVRVKVASPGDKKITIRLKSGKEYNLTEAEAAKAGIELPPPPPPPPAPGAAPPPPPPPPAPPMPSADDWVKVDASQRVQMVNGVPQSSGNTVMVRGLGYASTKPLYVIDDVIAPHTNLNELMPNTIERLNVLKGEHAALKYGAQHAVNGVIEIYTKNGGNSDADNDKEKIKRSVAPMGEVVVMAYKSNVLYVGASNIINVPNAPAGMKMFIANGRITKEGNYWIAEVASPCETTITLTAADGQQLGSFAFDARYLPENFKGNLSHTLQPDDGSKVFTRVEKEAAFPGGADAWRKYLVSKLDGKMPEKDNWKKGRYSVIVRFIVKADGSITDVVAENYAGSKTAAMCIDLIQKGPKWIPAEQNKRVVSAYRRQPITFMVE